MAEPPTEFFIHWDKWLESFQKRLPRHGTCNLPFRKKFLLSLFPQTLLFIFFWQAKVALFAKKTFRVNSNHVFHNTYETGISKSTGRPLRREFYAKIPRLRLSLPALWWGESWLFLLYSTPLCQIRQDFPWFTCIVLFFMIFWFNPPIVCWFSCLRNVHGLSNPHWFSCEPRKKTWWFRVYRGLYFPII